MKNLILLTLLLSASWAMAGDKPNIVVILADDFGYRSTNTYGADPKFVRTPHIDRIAREGIQFNQAYAPGSVCSPTRYAFMTGRYAWRGRLQYGVLNPPEGPLLVEDELHTLPEFLQSQGYATAHIGKWHLGYTRLPNVDDLSAQPLAPGPRSMGFDYHFAVPNQIDWLPKVYVENESIWGLRSPGKNPYGKSFYQGQPYHGYDAPQREAKEVTQDLSDAARTWIRRTIRTSPEKPFFLYFAPVAVHHPISPSELFRGTSGIGPYGDFIHDLDHSVGEILDALAYAGVLDNTLVIFTSDNGGDFCPEEDQGRQKGFMNNGELRGDKHTIYEGGLRVPFVARWPQKIPAGAQSEHIVNLVDLYATFQETVTGEVMDASKAAADSFSFYPALTGKTMPQRETMILSDVLGVHALRVGDWKFIEDVAKRPQEQKRQAENPDLIQPELYNLAKDPSETTNVIKQYPEIATKMQARLNHIRASGSERMARP